MRASATAVLTNFSDVLNLFVDSLKVIQDRDDQIKYLSDQMVQYTQEMEERTEYIEAVKTIHGDRGVWIFINHLSSVIHRLKILMRLKDLT